MIVTPKEETEILLMEDHHAEAQFIIQRFRRNNLFKLNAYIDIGEEAQDFIFERNAQAGLGGSQ